MQATARVQYINANMTTVSTCLSGIKRNCHTVRSSCLKHTLTFSMCVSLMCCSGLGQPEASDSHYMQPGICDGAVVNCKP